MPVQDRDIARLADAARLARTRAYAPYSNFPVGCALLLADGTVVTGANVENGSYGLGLCAERAAMASLFADHPPGERTIAAVVVAGPDGVADCSPCGACRQWIHELAPDAVVAFPWHGELVAVTVDELLPFGFELD
jgi:cytidine deaminase